MTTLGRHSLKLIVLATNLTHATADWPSWIREGRCMAATCQVQFVMLLAEQQEEEWFGRSAAHHPGRKSPSNAPSLLYGFFFFFFFGFAIPRIDVAYPSAPSLLIHEMLSYLRIAPSP